MKDTSVIPKGPYCYTFKENDEYYVCPYYDKVKDGEEQADGYCHFLEKSDVDLGKEAFESVNVNIKENGVEVNKEDVPDFIFTGLLWDQVKECGINDEWNEEE